MISQRRLKRIREVVGLRQRDFVVVLEDIHDPHNAAAVLRTCEAFGIASVYFIFQQEKSYNPKKVGKSSSASANKWLDIRVFRSTAECLRGLKRAGYVFFATALQARAQSIFQADFARKKIALLFGNEHRGLSQAALQGSDKILKIPMRGMVQSLNLSVTAAICVYEVTRQRLASRKRITLSPRQQRLLRKNWAK